MSLTASSYDYVELHIDKRSTLVDRPHALGELILSLLHDGKPIVVQWGRTETDAPFTVPCNNNWNRRTR